MSPLRISIAGANGRMGVSLLRCIAQRDDVILGSALVRSGVSVAGDTPTTDNISTALSDCDALIDFTSPDFSVELSGRCVDANIVHVIGTTGFTEAHERILTRASQKIPMIVSGNFSLGINVLSLLIEQASRALPDYDIEISEMHHRHKVDSPSGTALMLGESAARGRNIDLSTHSERGRDGNTGERGNNTIGFSSIRGGGVIGEHTVQFAADQEVLQLGHRALDRDLFAQGAITAALWGSNQPAGKYDMQDVLSEKIKGAMK